MVSVGAPKQRVPDGEHLAQWMSGHNDMTLEQQQQALRREPGFNELPKATQQRFMERLSQLHAMPSDQRQRVCRTSPPGRCARWRWT